MKRREFLTGVATGAAATTLIGCEGPQPREAAPADGEAPAVHTGKNVIWRCTSSFPRSLDTLYGGAEVVAERVAAMTDGAFQIKVYPAGELVPGLQVLDAVQQGTVQLGQTASYYYIGKNPALAFDCCVPFGLTSRQITGWLEEGGGRELVDELFADFNVKTFLAGNTGVQMGGWFKREVGPVDDLAGLTMRIPGMGGKVMAELGVAVQNIAGGEIYQALETGAIDATEWVGPYDDEKLGFHKAASFYYYPGWWEPGPSLSFYVNQGAWGSLPKAYQEVFASACRESALVMQARYDARNPPALQRLLAEGVQLRPFDPSILKRAKEAAEQIYADAAAADPAYAKVFASFDKARREAARWFGTAEAAYLQATLG